MTDGDARSLDISLDFPDPAMSCTALIWKDGDDAGVHPVHLNKEMMQVDQTAIVQAKPAEGGGHVMMIQPDE